MRDIERTDEKDVVIVLGLSGAGISTFVQFVGNESNTLTAECEWGQCKIIDETDKTEYIISKAFLPNLVVHESKKTPFYDMPGFNDNRNASIEIANSFFIRQVLDQAERIKIVVLARYASFSISAKQDFIALLKNLCQLMVHPEKFKGAMSIISTVVPPNLAPVTVLGRTTQFLKQDLYERLDEIFQGEEEYKQPSKSILENWLETDTGNYWDAKYVSYFYAPDVPGPLSENEKMKSNKLFLDEVIWDRLQFAPKLSEDFGDSLSDSALTVLERTGDCVLSSLKVVTEEFAKDLEETVMEKFTAVQNGNDEDLWYLTNLLTAVTQSDFNIDDTKDKPLSAILKRLGDEVNKLDIPPKQTTSIKIQEALMLIEFIELTKVRVQFNPGTLIMKMQVAKSNVCNLIITTCLTLIKDRTILIHDNLDYNKTTRM